MKKHLGIVLSGLLFLGSIIPVHAQSINNITVNVNDKKMEIVGHPAVLDVKTGRVLIPFKSLFLALGVPQSEIKWNAQTSTATGNKDGISVELTKNNVNAKVNGVSIKMDNAPVIMGSSMMVPLSFVAKYMGGRASWVGKPSYVVNITMEDGLFPANPPTNPSTPPPVNPSNPTNPVNPPKTNQNIGKAPAKDTGRKNSDIWGTFAVMNRDKEVLVAQFKSDLTLDVKNSTTGKVETAGYTINNNIVTINSSLIGGTYTLSTTKYLNKEYYVLRESNASGILAMTVITYEAFASVY